jgi:superfamily I DNA/RNA helicase
MTDPEPNAAQQELIEHTEGIALVDAGAGTGKTLAVTRRYAHIVDQPGVEPEDVLLATFTRSAATEMRERIVDHSTYGAQELADAPIRTFHAHAQHLLQDHATTAPTHLGIDDRITASTRVIEDDLVEREQFREFIGQFRDAHPEYADTFRTLADPTDLLDLIAQLAAKGVVPTREGWYRDSDSHLEGDRETFREYFEAVNEPRNGGRKQSELREKLARYGTDKTYLPAAPSKEALRGERGTKRVDPGVLDRLFDADREGLTAFVHDVYFEYLAFAVEHNYLNFGFLQVLAVVALMEDQTLRERVEFEYVMVDEFQDTSEIQFKLALLLAGTPNFCAVGDWKQSIYGFQYAASENITDFDARLDRFREALNDGADRVPVEGEITRIELTENYRSTQRLLDFSEAALLAPATSAETVDESVRERIVSLDSNAPFPDTRIEAIQHAEEHRAVLSKIQAIVGNEDYPVADDEGEPRPPEYGDIAVLTRTRDYGRELLQVAEDHGIAMAYDGGVELFRTDPAKLLLAWLRILETDADRGWAPVLERAGYSMAESRAILETGAYPEAMATFREELDAVESIAGIARRVFDRYGTREEYGDVVLETLESVHQSTTLTRGDLIDVIERAIETGATHEVHTSAGEDAVTVQTIHAAKGLEYPIVILANMNEGRFPPRSRDSKPIQFHESVGLHRRKQYATVGAYPHVYDDWRTDVLRHCLPAGYDEERRLLYVAITRAKHHVVFAAGETPNAFLEALPVDIEPHQPEVTAESPGEPTQATLPFSVSPGEGPIGLSAHDLIDESVFEAAGGPAPADQSGGTDRGDRVHDFAEAYVAQGAERPEDEHERAVASFLDGLAGDLRTETPVTLPLEVAGTHVSISGIVDLVELRPESVWIVDYKTDSTRRAEAEYRKQLSVYYHVLEAAYPDRSVTASLFFTAMDEVVPIEPLPRTALAELVETTLDREEPLRSE